MSSTSTLSFHAQIAEAYEAADAAWNHACDLRRELTEGRSLAVQCGDQTIPCRVVSYDPRKGKYSVEVEVTDMAAMVSFGKPFLPSHVDAAWFDVAPQFLVELTEGGAA